MLDEKKAYEILGVKEGTSKDEIIKRYNIKLKSCSLNQNDPDDAESKEKLKLLGDAYNLLMGYEIEIDESADIKKKPNPVLKKMGLDEKKVNNFFYYYKFHILIGVIVLIAVIFTVRGCVTRVDPDLSVVFMGDMYCNDWDTLQQQLQNQLSGVKAVSVDTILLRPNMDVQEESALQMKAAARMAAGDVDVYIMDRSSFDTYAKQGAFASLDDLAGTLGIDKTKNESNVFLADGEQSEHLYGIDISKSPVLKNTIVQGDEEILAIGVRTKFYDNAVKLLKLLLK